MMEMFAPMTFALEENALIPSTLFHATMEMIVPLRMSASMVNALEQQTPIPVPMMEMSAPMTFALEENALTPSMVFLVTMGTIALIPIPVCLVNASEMPISMLAELAEPVEVELAGTMTIALIVPNRQAPNRVKLARRTEARQLKPN
jgi:hypothetical protein